MFLALLLIETCTYMICKCMWVFIMRWIRIRRFAKPKCISYSLQKWKKRKFWQVIALSRSCYWLTEIRRGCFCMGWRSMGIREWGNKRRSEVSLSVWWICYRSDWRSTTKRIDCQQASQQNWVANARLFAVF